MVNARLDGFSSQMFRANFGLRRARLPPSPILACVTFQLITPTERSKRLREITLELFKSTESLASKMTKLDQLLPSDGQAIPQLSILERIAQLAEVSWVIDS